MLATFAPAIKSLIPKKPMELIPNLLDRHKFPTKVDIYFERGRYIVKTVSTYREYWQARRLRYEVFYREFVGKKMPFGFDNDPYDAFGDILIIWDKESKKVIGTYRLLCSQYTDLFYSATEFNIDQFLRTPGHKIELSRACIHRHHRTGVVISLLWKGLAQYIARTRSQILFGCSSIPTIHPQVIARAVMQMQEDGCLQDSFQVTTLPEYKPSSSLAFEMGRLRQEPAAAPFEYPALLRSYLKAGATLASEPAFDRKFRCYDFFTILKYDDLNFSYRRKYAETTSL